MAQEGDNYNDDYYLLIQTRSNQIIFKPDSSGQASSIALGILTCQFNAFLQTSRPGSIEIIKN